LLTHLERSACDAAATFARGQEYLACAAHAAVVLDERSVAAHARLGAVEYRRLAEVILVREPVPVRLVALCVGAQCQHVSRGLVRRRWGFTDFVAAFFSQRLLVPIDKVPVPAQEVAGPVDRQSLVYVHRDEIVVAVLERTGMRQ
jgi:hypothetical protein